MPALAHSAISANRPGDLVVRLTPRGRVVRACLAAISPARTSDIYGPASDDAKAADIGGGANQIGLGNPAHRAAEDGGFRAKKGSTRASSPQSTARIERDYRARQAMRNAGNEVDDSALN